VTITAVVLADHLYKWARGVEKMREGGGGKRTQLMHANSVDESMSATYSYTTF